MVATLKGPRSRKKDALPLGSVGSLSDSLRREGIAMYALLGYLLFEYVRPQSIYPQIDLLPWTAAFLMLSVVLALREQLGRSFQGGISVLLVMFTLLVTMSSVFAYSRAEAFDKFDIYFNWVLLYFAFVSIVNTPSRWVLVMAAFLLFSFKMSQHGMRTWAMRGFSFADWGLGGPPGWFANSGELGIQMCVFLPLSVGFILAFQSRWSRLIVSAAWLMPITAIATILGSSSRGAVVGGVCSLLPFLVRSKYRTKAFLAIAGATVIGYLLMPPEFIDRFRSAGADRTSTARLERWEAGIEMMLDHPILGVGYFNWPVYYPPTYKPGTEGGMLSHNIFIQAGSELGVTGLVLFVAMITACFIAMARVRKAVIGQPEERVYGPLVNGMDGAMIGFIVSGFFVTVLYYPYFWVQLAFTASLYKIGAKQSGRAPRRPFAYSIGARDAA